MTTIEVTQEDIDAGCRSDAFGCPIARAAMRAFGIEDNEDNETRVGVAPGYLRLIAADRKSAADYEMPDQATNFMRRFDKSFEVHPFTFKLDTPPVVHSYANL